MWDATIPDWINAIAAAIGASAVIIGLVGAKNAVETNRKAARSLRRSEVAEELISLSLNAEDALRQIRNPFSSIPAKKLGDKEYYYQSLYDRVLVHNDLFKSLRNAQIKVRAIIGDS